MTKNIELRSRAGIELRALEGKPGVLVGYAAIFDSPSEDIGGFVEVIRKGAFSKSLSDGAEILALCYHDWDEPLARRSAGTLKLSEDGKGLRIEITLADTTRARDLVADINSGNVNGMSFGFMCRKDSWTMATATAPALRELLDVELLEVSVTACPAYPDTTIAARSMEAALKNGARPDTDALKRLRSAHTKLISLTL